MFRITSQLTVRHSNQVIKRSKDMQFSTHSAVQKLKFVLEDYRLHK